MNPAQTDEAAVDVERRLALHRLLTLRETLAPRTAALVGFRHGRIHVFHERSAVARPFFEKRPARFHHDVGIEIEKPVGVTDRKSLLALRGVGISGGGERHDRFGVVVGEEASSHGSRVVSPGGSVPECTRTPSCQSPRWRRMRSMTSS